MIYDILILGGGPAGLSASLYASRKALSTLLVAGNLGGQVANYFDVDNYLGFSLVESAELITRFQEHVDRFELGQKIGVRAVEADLAGPVKKVLTDEGEWVSARTLVIATGAEPRTLNVPGEAEFRGRGVAYCSTCDAPLFAGAEVAVAGGGNSALEAVVDLARVGARVTVLSLTPLTADESLTARVMALENVTVKTGVETLAIEGGDMGVTGLLARDASGEEFRLAVEGVFVEIGQTPLSGPFKNILALNGRGEILIDQEMRTSVPGVFAAGDVTSVPFKQVVVAAGEGAKAALAAYRYLMEEAF